MGPPSTHTLLYKEGLRGTQLGRAEYCLAKESGRRGLSSGFRAQHRIGCRRQQGTQAGVRDSDLGWSDCIVIIRSSKATGRWLRLVEGV